MYSYKIFKNEQLISIQFSGEVVYGDILKSFAECTSDPDFQPTYSGVADLRKVRLSMTPQEAKDLAHHVVENRLSEGKWAILVDDPANTALSFLYAQEVSRQHPMSVLNTIKAASKFLDRPELEFLV